MKPSLRISLIALATGLGFDQTFAGRTPGLAVPLLVAGAAAGFRHTAPRSRETDALLGTAVAISAIVAFRSEVAVVGPAFLAVAGLMILAVTVPGRPSVAVMVATDAAERTLAVARGAFRVPRFLTTPFLSRPAGHAPTRRVWRAAALSAVVVGIFGALLASADRVFADTLIPNVSLGSAPGRIAMVMVGTWLAGGMWAATAGPSPAIHVGSPRLRLTSLEWTTALAALTALFAAFVVVQFAFLFGGSHRVEVTPGLTYAQYARSGFFQLLAAGALTAGALLAAWDLRDRDAHRSRFLALAATPALLCLIILASAATRLALYQQAFGYTTARIGAWLAIGAVGAALVGLIAAIAIDRRRRVFSGGAAIALAVVVVAAVVSPSALVARHNIERFEKTGKIDVAYLTTLGPEAIPALVEALPKLDVGDRAFLGSFLCGHAGTGGGGWRSWNHARARAAAAIARLHCDEPDRSVLP